MISFARDLARFQPVRTVVLFMLLICAAATEGMTLISVVPMIEYVGAADQGSSQIMTLITAGFDAVGLPVSLRVIVSLFLLAVVLRAVILFTIADISARATMAFLHHMRTDLFAALTCARWSALVRHPRSGLYHALTNVPYQLAHGLAVVVRVFSSASLVAVGCLLALLTEPTTTAIVLIAAALLAAPMFVYSRATYRLSEAEYEKAGVLYSRIGAYLNNLKLSRFIGRSGDDPGGFNATSLQDAELLRRIDWIDAKASLVHQLGAVALLAVAIGVVSGLNTDMGQGSELISIAVLAVIFARIVPQAQVLFANLRQVAEIRAPYKAYCELLATLRLESEPPYLLKRQGSGAPEIRLESVSYSYDGASDALQAVDIVIPAGTTFAVIGPSGAGKTTMADILCGLLLPSNGRVFVNEKPLQEPDLAAWRNRVGLVSQDEFILPGTIRDNVAPGGGLGDAEIWAALTRTGLTDRIRSSPDALDMPIGEQGERLSRGERQRLGLARALARKPDLLILDEATSALNPVDEAEIIRHLIDMKGQMTSVIIAHRLSSLVHADHMIALQKGRITESGPANVLVGHPGSLANRMQAIGAVQFGDDDGNAEPDVMPPEHLVRSA